MIDDADSAVFLRDGSTAAIRAYGQDDRPLLDDLFARLSAETLRLRFHSGARTPTPRRCSAAPAPAGSWRESAASLVGAACYIPLTEPGLAELAVVVSDAEHGRGIGMRLVERLAEAARREGIPRLLAMVMAENRPMLHLLDDLGFADPRRAERRRGRGRRSSSGRTPATSRPAIPATTPARSPRCGRCSSRARSPSSARRARPEAVGHAVLAEPARGRLPRAGLRRQPGRRRGRRRPRLSRRSRPPPARSTWPSSACRRRTCSTWPDDCIAAGVHAIVGGDGRVRRESAEGAAARGRAAAAAAAAPACGWSARTASASSAAGRASRSTRPSRATRPPAGNVAISSQSGARRHRAAGAGARGLGMGVSLVRLDRQQAPTCRRTTCSSAGRTTARPA